MIRKLVQGPAGIGGLVLQCGQGLRTWIHPLPTTYTLTFSGVVLDGACSTWDTTRSRKVTAGALDGTYTLTRIASSNGVGHWRLVMPVPPFTTTIYQDAACTTFWYNATDLIIDLYRLTYGGFACRASVTAGASNMYAFRTFVFFAPDEWTCNELSNIDTAFAPGIIGKDGLAVFTPNP